MYIMFDVPSFKYKVFYKNNNILETGYIRLYMCIYKSSRINIVLMFL